MAAVGIAVLGLGVAGSLALTGHAEDATQHVVADQQASSTPVRTDATSSGSPQRFRLAEPALWTVTERPVTLQHLRQPAALAAVRQPGERLRTAASVAGPKKEKARATRAVDGGHQTAAASSIRSSEASLPITSRYHIAARFGDTGFWGRYHTGLDFAAPIGTPIHAILPGVVTHAGSGSARWAGHYVTIRHADGKSTLYAHMSHVAVHEGQLVGAGQRIGAVGMTGRSFGPHVHVELYPAGVRPGHIYSAVNPAPWLPAHGLRF